MWSATLSLIFRECVVLLGKRTFHSSYSGDRMKDFLIDIGDGACYAGCDHCRYSAVASKGKMKLSEKQIAAYRAFEDYAHRIGRGIRLAPMNRFHEIEDLSFVLHAESVALSFDSVEQVLLEKDLKDKIPKLMPNNRELKRLSFQPRFDPVAEVLPEEAILAIFRMQIALIRDLGLAKVILGLNANRTNDHPALVRMKLLEYALMYQMAAELFLRQGRSSIAIDTFPIQLDVWVDIDSGSWATALTGRFISAQYDVTALRAQEDLDRGSDTCAMAFFPWGVHFNHSTFNINDNALKFGYDEFNEILSEAGETMAPIKDIFFGRVDRRRAKREYKIRVT